MPWGYVDKDGHWHRRDQETVELTRMAGAFSRELDEIEMELGGKGMKVGDRVRTYYTRKEGVITGPCPRHKGNWLVDVGDETCDVKCAAECNLIPVEPEREARECSHVEKCGRPHEWVSVGGKAYCDPMNGTCTLHSYASRLSLITYPELFICEKAGECKGKDGCFAGKLHDRTRFCERGDWCSTAHAHRHCIPYVPEGEGNDWVTIYGPAFTKRTKAETERIVKVDPGYRAFKWSTGLKGGE